MQLTHSYSRVFPRSIQKKYVFRETRNAAAVLASTSPQEFAEITGVLKRFWLVKDDFLKPGGNKGKVAIRLDEAFRKLGWREGRYDTTIQSKLNVMPYKAMGEREITEIVTEAKNEGYKTDNVKGSVALDVEWNAKDGNLDRDVGAYRALYDAGVISVGVVLTRTTDDLRAIGKQLGRDPLGTTTTTNVEKLEHRLARGDAGGCPVLAIAISAKTYR